MKQDKQMRNFSSTWTNKTMACLSISWPVGQMEVKYFNLDIPYEEAQLTKEEQGWGIVPIFITLD